MELNRKWWWYCGTSISVPSPRVQMLHLRCGRLQWWEQLLCCELTGKTERMQKCQEREGDRTSDRNKDWGPVKDCLCTSSARFISSTLLARRVKLSWIFTNRSAFQIKIGPLGALGPQDWGSGKRKIVRANNKWEQTGNVSRVKWKQGSSWTYFQASKRPFLFYIDFQMLFLLSCYLSSKQ